MFTAYPVWIEEGPQDWQVIQQHAGWGTVRLAGGQRLEDTPGRVYLRAVDGSTGRDVVPWHPAQIPEAGRWTGELRLPLGGPYRIETCAKAPETDFRDAFAGASRLQVYVGDVYLIAGQSNAVGYARDVCEDPPLPGVSLFRLRGRWDLAVHPLHEGTDCSYVNLDVPLAAHSPWLSFAKTVYRATGTPVGLLPGALGGSSMDAWEPGGILYENALRMIRAAGGAVRAVLWYQGCADALAKETDRYLARFQRMVRAMRQTLGTPELPFFTCQLNSFTNPAAPEEDAAWAAIRTAQARAAAEDPNVYLLPTAGLPLCDGIHNSGESNLRIGGQMALLALETLYGRAGCFHPLRVASAVAESGRIVLTVTGAEDLRVGPRIRDAFAAWREDRRLEIASVRAETNQLHIQGKDLGLADRLEFGLLRDLQGRGVTDGANGGVLAPFLIRIQNEAAERGEKEV